MISCFKKRNRTTKLQIWQDKSHVPLKISKDWYGLNLRFIDLNITCDTWWSHGMYCCYICSESVKYGRRDAADTTKFQTAYLTWTFGPGIGVLHISSLRIVFVPNMRQILQMNSHVAMERTQNRVLSVVRPWNGVRRPVIVSICAKNKVQSSNRYGATENLKWPMWPHHFDLEMVHKHPYGLYLYQIWRKSLKKARTTERT